MNIFSFFPMKIKRINATNWTFGPLFDMFNYWDNGKRRITDRPLGQHSYHFKLPVTRYQDSIIHEHICINEKVRKQVSSGSSIDFGAT